MGKIKKLSTELINLIAAGEVVERPASAVKELMENAIDAGATKITVNIEEYGTKLIEVVDNGSGMDQEDAVSAFIQHATSKIGTAADLEKIHSLGFRGEALASISQVSEETIIETQQIEASKGTVAHFRSGNTNHEEKYVREKGTSIKVKSLFKNYPARLKFLKSASTENKYIEETFKSIAFVNPNIEFELNVDKKNEYKLPATQDKLSRIYDIWGKDVAGTLYKEELYDGSALKISLIAGKPEVAKKSNPLQMIYVNHRPINSKVIHAAVVQGYEGSIHRELKPNYAIMIQIDPELVDVNIHPRKMEVKFDNDQDIFKLVYGLVKKTLEKHARNSIFSPQPENAKSYTDLPFRTSEPSQSFSKPQFSNKGSSSKEEAISFSRILSDSVRDISTITETTYATENFKPIQIFNTYIVFQKDNEIYIVDQHAAAEKVLFEKMVNEYTGEKPRSKPLLVPEILELKKFEKETVLENIELFHKMGLVIEDFGGNSVRITEIPELLRDFDAKGFIDGIIEREEDLIPLKQFNNDYDLTEEEYYVIATAACHGSIRAGQILAEYEMISLLKSIDFISRTQNCPHGRPIVTKLRREDIEKNFKRVI